MSISVNSLFISYTSNAKNAGTNYLNSTNLYSHLAAQLTVCIRVTSVVLADEI